MAVQDDDEQQVSERPNKSLLKREAAALKELGDELVALPAAELEALPLPEKLLDAVLLARRITAHGGAARQRQLIGKILRRTDLAAIRAVIEARALERRLQARDFHRIESWRDRLLAEGAPAIAALGALAPGLDAAALARLVASAEHEALTGRPPAAARELFRRLREALAAPDPSA